MQCRIEFVFRASFPSSDPLCVRALLRRPSIFLGTSSPCRHPYGRQLWRMPRRDHHCESRHKCATLKES